MKKTMKSALSLLLTILMLFSIAQICASAEEADVMTISASEKTAFPGSTVDVDIMLKNNPGVSSIGLDVGYDKKILSLEKIVYNTEMGGNTQSSSLSDNPATLLWVNSSANFSKDATFATLTFKVSTNAKDGDVADIKFSFDEDNIYNLQENNVSCQTVDGKITVQTLLAGDINNDGKVNNKDVSRLMQYLAHWEVDVNESVLDCNGDNKLNNKDVTRLMQYLAHWDVKLHPIPSDYSQIETDPLCEHQLKKIEAVVPTCKQEGHNAYYECSVCGKKFSDFLGKTEVKDSDLAIPKLAHTIVIDPAVAPTPTSEGKTEGSHCSVCGEIIAPQETIPITDNYIIYNVAGENPYLQKQVINNSNPTTYSSTSSLRLKNISCPGYQFLGWYDLPEGAAAENVKEIPAGTTGEVELYAWWKPVTYNIEFKSDLIPIATETYTVEHSHVLPTPSLNGYIFAGWSDDDGNVIKTIPEGTTGHKTYTANWISERNQAWAKTEYDAPIVHEDEETGTILFAYDIGEIRNVPVSVIHDFGKINSDGVSKEVTKTVTKTVEKEEMEKYTNTVSKSTTDSFAWTLSEGWSEGITVNESWLNEKGITTEEANTYSKTDSNNWYVSSGQSGYDTTVTLDTKDKYNLKTTTKNKKTYDTEDKTSYDSTTTKKYQDFSANLKASLSKTIGATIPLEGIKLAASKTLGLEGGAKYGNGKSTSAHTGSDTTTHTGTEKDKEKSKQTGSISHTGTESTHNSSWNSESGYGGSSSVSQSSTVSKAISEKIAQSYGYGKSYIKNSDETQSQGLTSSNANSDEYSSAVTYSTVEGESTTMTYSTSNTKSGYHRWVMAGTAHVFAVVGYDIKSSSYFTYTYTVMDDEMHEFEDYSYSYASYDDNQNTVIPFEIPVEVDTYVANRVCESDGLEVSKSGVVTGYSGTDEYVVIPEYKVIDNRDGTKSIIKITGISENAFKGNSKITGIELSEFITEIPDNAFANCVSLSEINATAVTSIGDNAFTNCTELVECSIGEEITHLGENAVTGLERLIVRASNPEIVKAAVNSGAKSIYITISDKCSGLDDTKLVISDETDSCTFNGLGKTFNNLSIESNAKTTIINRATFVSSGMPLKLSSEEVELNEVTVKTNGIAMLLSSPTTKVSLLGTVELNTSSENAVVCKNITLGKLDDNIYSELKVKGNILICGSITNEDYLKLNGEIIEITEDEFNKYLAGVFKLKFNANGGETSVAEKTAYYGSAIGDLPTATKDYYSFDGWYTESDGGEKILPDTRFNSSVDVMVYAHWTKNPTSDWVLESQLPENAKVESTKWTYDLVTRKKSSSSTMSGYTKYDTTWVWGSYGSWSGWQTAKVNGSDSRYVDTRNVAAKTHTEWHYYRWINGSYVYTYQPNNNYHFEETWTKSELPISSINNDNVIRYMGSDKYENRWIRADYSGNRFCDRTYTRTVTDSAAHTEYRYKDRSKVYTYYFSKTEAKESTTEIKESINTSAPSESITNVKKWVKYVNK